MQVQSRYQNGKVYKLVNCVDDKIYIGSTCARLSKRFYEHKQMAKIRPTYVHKHLNSIGWENVRIILIENVIAETKDQLLIREQNYIDELKPELNKHAAYAHCPHGRTHFQCVECHGAGICEHNRIKSKCKECGGSQICEHNRQKASCKECGGASICEHNRRKYECKECGGSRICEHNRIKASCKDCNGDKYKCIICNHVFGSVGDLNRHRRSVKHHKKINEFFNTYKN